MSSMEKSDFDILKEMLRPEVYVQPKQDNHSKKWSVALSEPGVSRCKVTIDNVPADGIVIKADKFYPVIGENDVLLRKFFFKSDHGECKRADFIMVSEQKKMVVFIEMKKTKNRPNSIIKQLKGAECLFRYCQNIGKSFWEKEHFLNYECRYVCIAEISIQKTTTSVLKKAMKLKNYSTTNTRVAFHNKPEHFLKVERPNELQYDMLVG